MVVIKRSTTPGTSTPPTIVVPPLPPPPPVSRPVPWISVACIAFAICYVIVLVGMLLGAHFSKTLIKGGIWPDYVYLGD